MRDDKTRTIEGCLADLLSAVGGVALAGRAASGYSGRIDVEAARGIFEALHNVGHVHEAMARGDAEGAESFLSWTRDAFAALPADIHGRDAMLDALDAYRDAARESRDAPSSGAFPSSLLR